MNKLFFSLFLAFQILSLLAGWASAASNKKVKAGIFAFEGYHEQDKAGHLSGYGIDFLGLLSRYSHLNFDYTGFDNSWDDMLKMLQNGEIDIVTTARRTPEREELFGFSIPIGKNTTILSTRLNNTKLRVGDYQHWNGIKIGVLKGSTQNAILEKYAKNRGFTYIPVEFSDSHALTDALQKGEVDAILTSNLRKSRNEKPLDSLDSNNFYAIVRKDDQELLREINYAIEQMDQNEGDWRNILFYKNYGPEISDNQTFTSRENKYIEDVKAGNKKLIALTASNRPPYSWLENGKIRGILPDYFQIIMEKAGLPYDIIIGDSEDDNHPADIDVVLDSTIPDKTTADSSKNGFDTPVYLTTGVAMVTRADFHGNPAKIAITRSQLTAELRRRLPPATEFIYYPTQTEAMEAVGDGKVQAAIVDGYTAQNFVNQNSSKDLIYTILNDISTNFRMHVPANADHELVTIINKIMQQDTEDAINSLILKYTTPELNKIGFFQYIRNNPKAAFYAVLIGAIVVCVMFGLYFKSRMNRKLFMATEKSNHELEEQLAIVEALSRDYTSVFALNDRNGVMRPIKLEESDIEDMEDYDAIYNYKKFVDIYIDTRVHPEDRAALARDLSLNNVKDNFKNSQEYSGTYRRIGKDGEYKYYQYTYIGFNNGVNSFIIAGFRNIDDMIRKEQDQNAILSDALAKANSANIAKTKFLNNMSHDIRTPMNAIIGFTHLASTNLANRELVGNFLGKIMTSGNHLVSLINDVLDMSRIESGKVELDEKETSLPDIINDIKTIVQSDIKGKNLTFHVKLVNIVNEIIICDKLRLRQILINILSNAVKYTPSGGEVKLLVTQTGKTSDNRARFEFVISDNGIGMEKEFLGHVFEPFERERTSTVSGIEGTGLGLAITKNILDMMGGAIRAESVKGEGSEFFVNLDFQVPAPLQQASFPELSGKRCCLVTDDENTRENTLSALWKFGLDSVCLSGPGALEADLENAEAYPCDFYIIDWNPAAGFKYIKNLAQKAGVASKIILLTEDDWTDYKAKAHEAGVSAFVAKPVFLSALAQAMQNGEEKIQEEEAPDFTGKRVLLVDDNEINREIGEMILENLGLEVDLAEDGSEAVEKIKTGPAHTWDLVLMDVQMPIMDGYSATRAIRKLEDQEKARIKIVAMTANAFEEDRKEAMESGMEGYIAKPIDLKQLTETLRQIL